MFSGFFRERARTGAVRKIAARSVGAGPSLDRFVAQAADAFAAPIAVLTLIDRDRLWIKASRGFDSIDVPRRDTFCHFALDGHEPLEACDATADERFRDLPCVVGTPNIRYYIGTALTLANGLDVGTLCVCDDRVRRPASGDQRAYLVALARQASQALDWGSLAAGGLAA